jgi:GT2 family glycosyltransferase
MESSDVTVAIPTYRRGPFVLSTARALLAQRPKQEIVIVDQTEQHDREVEEELARLATTASVRWLRLSAPSIPGAMNVALTEAETPLVLFLDDDVVPAPELVAAHVAGFSSDTIWATVGQVLQPGQEPSVAAASFRAAGLQAFLDFPFHSSEPLLVNNVMAGNLCVRRDRAVQVGGFDENFVGSAYRFETEFCRRLIRAGGQVLFQPAATLRHLRAGVGGVRSGGRHESSASPVHGVGDYYFALGEGTSWETVAYILRRPVREVCTSFHLRNPWWIAPKLFGEIRALAWAFRLRAAGPRLLGGTTGRHQPSARH